MVRRARLAPALGWVLVVLAGAAVVIRVAIATVVLPAATTEPQLVDAAYAGGTGGPAVPVEGPLLTTGLQLRLYTAVTWAFDRHADALTSAREMSVAATVALVLGLIAFAAILRVPAPLIALTIAPLAVIGPIVTLLATLGPAGPAAGWFAFAMAAGAAALLRRDFRWITAGAFTLLGTAFTMPGLLVPVLFGTAAALVMTTRLRPAWCAIAALACVAAALVVTALVRRMRIVPLLDTSERLLMLTAVVIIAALAATITLVRTWSVGIGLGALAAMTTGATAELVLPALLVAALGLLAVTIDEARTAPLASHRAYAGAAAAVAFGGCVAGIFDQPTSGPRPDHAALADWIRTQTAPGIPLAAMPGIWADLDRDLTKSGRSRQRPPRRPLRRRRRRRAARRHRRDPAARRHAARRVRRRPDRTLRARHRQPSPLPDDVQPRVGRHRTGRQQPAQNHRTRTRRTQSRTRRRARHGPARRALPQPHHHRLHHRQPRTGTRLRPTRPRSRPVRSGRTTGDQHDRRGHGRRLATRTATAVRAQHHQGHPSRRRAQLAHPRTDGKLPFLANESRSAMRARKTISALAALLFAGSITFVAAPAADAAATSYVRLAHLSPDTPAVDVTVTAFGKPGEQVIKGVKYGDVSSYQSVQPGSYTIAMRPAGADPKSPPVISATLDATNGHAYTVAGLGKFATLALRVLDDDITLPPAGRAKMRVVNAAPTAGDLSIQRNGTPVITNAKFGQASPYSLVQAGEGKLTLTPKSASDTSLSVTLAAGGVYTVLVLEHNNTLSAQVRLDAKGAQVVPNGPVETGFGGTADTTSGDTDSGLPTLGYILLIGAAIAGGAGALRLARRA